MTCGDYMALSDITYIFLKIAIKLISICWAKWFILLLLVTTDW